MLNLFKPSKRKIVLFIIFAIIGFGSLFLQGDTRNFAISNPPNTGVKMSIDKFIKISPKSQPYCDKGSYYEQYYPNYDANFFAPFFGLLYGKICNKILLYILNIPYFYLWASVLDWIIVKFPLYPTIA